MADLRVIGIDPGPTPGFVVLDLCDRAEGSGRWIDRTEVLQCSHGVAADILNWLVIDAGNTPVLVQTEAFVHSRQGRSGASTLTRNLVAELQHTAAQHNRAVGGDNVRFCTRPAAQVKPWATSGQRLDKAGLWEPTAGMQHARSAAWHALFAACHDGGLPDPLSKDWR